MIPFFPTNKSKIIFTGKESSGKTLAMAGAIDFCLNRNKMWYEKYGFKRKIVTNMVIKPDYLDKWKDYIMFFDNMDELTQYRGVDIFWDEIHAYFSAEKRKPLPIDLNRWLSQGAKGGNRIYGTAQEFHSIHVDFRRLVSNVYLMNKIIGSSRGGYNLPPTSGIWGLIAIKEVRIDPYNELEPEYINRFPMIRRIYEHYCDIFDTYQLVNKSAIDKKKAVSNRS